MRRIFIVISILMLLSNSLHASGDLKFMSAAPEGLKTLASNVKPKVKAPINSGPHGMKAHCYKSSDYFVFRENLLGNGYIISRDKPNNLVCIPASIKIVENSLGMYIGQSKQEIEELFEVKNMSNEQVIWWHSKTEIREIMFDVQTYALFKFSNNKLDYLSVFTTITN